MTSPPRPIIILGPTAGGKSDLAANLALALGGQVISADSMQVYRHLDAGTAKPSAALRAMAPHHLIDIVEPDEPFTVADWLARAEALIGELQARGVQPIIVGGTNLYLKSLLEGMFDGPPADAALRASLADEPNDRLAARLRQVDAPAADRIHINDRKRLIRAIEVHHQTGRPLSDLQQQWHDQPGETPYRHDPILIGLHWPAAAINPRINLRVKAMFYPEKVDPALAAEICPHGENLVDETRRLASENRLGDQARQALGYKQVLDAIGGQCSLEDAYERTKGQTRRFAKSQRTWLRRFAGVTWLDAAGLTPAALLDQALVRVREAGGER